MNTEIIFDLFAALTKEKQRDYYEVEGETGENINDMVWSRNRSVEERFNRHGVNRSFITIFPESVIPMYSELINGFRPECPVVKLADCTQGLSMILDRLCELTDRDKGERDEYRRAVRIFEPSQLRSGVYGGIRLLAEQVQAREAIKQNIKDSETFEKVSLLFYL